jgi:hypothetical protein
MPICCSDAAPNKTSPASVSPHTTLLRERGSGTFRRLRPTNRRGTRTALPSRNRPALNVNGPTCSIPARRATNADPQITEASRS